MNLKIPSIGLKKGNGSFFDSKSKKWTAVESKRHYANPVEQVQSLGPEFLKYLAYNNRGKLPVKMDNIFGCLFLLKQQSFPSVKNSLITVLTEDKLRKRLDNLLKTKEKSITDKAIEKVKKIILNNANYYPTFERKMEEYKKKIIALTREQYLLLDELENPNILLSGVAGSGKTLMALEAVQIAKRKKWKTLLICRSSNLNKYLNSICQKDKMNHVTVETMTSFCNKILSEAKLQGLDIETSSRIYEEDYVRKMLPGQAEQCLRNMTDIGMYDFMIIDEAQDVMSFTELSILDKFLKGGFDKGKWFVCYDEDQALFGEMKEGLDYIKSFNPKYHRLSANKRTPKSIYDLVCNLSGKSLSKADLDDFTTPQFISYGSAEGGKELLFEMIDNAVQERKFAAEDIIVLSPYKKTKTETVGTSVSLTKKGNINKYKIKVVNDGVFEKNCVGFSEITRFKGMERKYVILTGVDDFSKEEIANQLYVALTRSTHMLSILYHSKSSKSLMNRLGKKNANLIKNARNDRSRK